MQFEVLLSRAAQDLFFGLVGPALKPASDRLRSDHRSGWRREGCRLLWNL